MPFDPATDLPALAAELRADPAALGYAPHVVVGDQAAHRVLEEMIGLVRGTVAIKRADCRPVEILEAIDIRDFAATPTNVSNVPLAASWFESVTQFAAIRLTNENNQKSQIRKNIDRLVGDTNGSQARLDAVAVRAGSRAEQLWGVGSLVRYWDIGQALALEV